MTRGARSSRSGSGTARSSGATRSWSRRRPAPGFDARVPPSAARDGDRRRPSRRAAQCGHRRVPRRTRGRGVVPGGQRAAAGRARRDRARDRPRPRAGATLDRGRRDPQRGGAASRGGSRISRTARDRGPAVGRGPGSRRSPRCRVASGAGGRPPGRGIRMDDWVEDGSRIGGDYDPLLGKLLVVDADREPGHRPDGGRARPAWRSRASRRRCPSIAG